LEELKEELGANFLDFVEFKTAYSHDIVSNKVGANSRARKAAKLWLAGKSDIDTCVKEAMMKASEDALPQEINVEPVEETAPTDEAMPLSEEETPAIVKEQEEEEIETEIEVLDIKETEAQDTINDTEVIEEVEIVENVVKEEDTKNDSEIIEEEEVVEKCVTVDEPEEKRLTSAQENEIKEIETESEISENKATEAEDTDNDTEIIEEVEIVENCVAEEAKIESTNTGEIEEIETEGTQIDENTVIENLVNDTEEKSEDSKEDIVNSTEQIEVKECQEDIVTDVTPVMKGEEDEKIAETSIEISEDEQKVVKDVVEAAEEKLQDSNEDNSEAVTPINEEEIVSEPCIEASEEDSAIADGIQEEEKLTVEEPEQEMEVKASTEQHSVPDVQEIVMETNETEEIKPLEQPAESIVTKEEESLNDSELKKDSVEEVALSCDSASNNVKIEEKLNDNVEVKIVENNDDVSPLVNVLRQFQESMDNKNDISEQLDINAEEDKESTELSSAGSESDLGSLESPLDESDGDSSVENEEKVDSALDDDKEDELIKEKDVVSTKDESKVITEN